MVVLLRKYVRYLVEACRNCQRQREEGYSHFSGYSVQERKLVIPRAGSHITLKCLAEALCPGKKSVFVHCNVFEAKTDCIQEDGPTCIITIRRMMPHVPVSADKVIMLS
jgi:hypothetical protein